MRFLQNITYRDAVTSMTHDCLDLLFAQQTGGFWWNGGVHDSPPHLRRDLCGCGCVPAVSILNFWRTYPSIIQKFWHEGNSFHEAAVHHGNIGDLTPLRVSYNHSLDLKIELQLFVPWWTSFLSPLSREMSWKSCVRQQSWMYILG